mmetsp:Transcript_1943/g.2787  ORF Transcript_1943/g.2787 Transcript_1943/m.2787 type:complete len:158 (-) Transcript_1943:260-733(-)
MQTEEESMPSISMISNCTDDTSEGSSNSYFESSDDKKLSKQKKIPVQSLNLSRKEIISFGDSMEERTAVKIVSGQLSATSKSVMFLSSPNPTQLIGQLTMLTSHLKYVCENESSLDLEISPSQAQKYADSYMQGKGCTMTRKGVSSEKLSRITRAGC